MSDLICDVCNTDEHKPVRVCSGPGPCSWAYCTRCLAADYMPYQALVAYLWTVWGDHGDGCQPYYVECVKRTCAFLGKTMDDFEADIAEALKDLDDYFAKQDLLSDDEGVTQ